MSDRHPLVVKLKSGEYDGKDIMDAWILIERLTVEKSQAILAFADQIRINERLTTEVSELKTEHGDMNVANVEYEKRIEQLEGRLELYPVDQHGNKHKSLKLDIGDCDGIGCRDETIRLLDGQRERLTAEGTMKDIVIRHAREYMDRAGKPYETAARRILRQAIAVLDCASGSPTPITPETCDHPEYHTDACYDFMRTCDICGHSWVDGAIKVPADSRPKRPQRQHHTDCGSNVTGRADDCDCGATSRQDSNG